MVGITDKNPVLSAPEMEGDFYVIVYLSYESGETS